MKPEIKNSILAGLVFGFLFSIFFALSYGLQYALIVGLISGLAFGIILYFFITSKTVANQTQIGNVDGKTIIISGAANHFKNVESVGGKLYLLTDKLQFKSHDFNIQSHELIINLDKIKEIQIYNVFGFIPTGLKIETNDGQVEKFVVNNSRRWKDEIEKLIL